jgi:uncharacterized protein (DUF736 family)
MAFKLKVKKGTSAPASGVLDSGELGYNTNSSIVYIGNGSGVAATEIITASSTAQTKVGNFVTQGKLGGEYLELEASTGSSPTAGQLNYETESGTFRAGIFGNYLLDIGEKQVYFVENVTGSTIAKGTVVGFSGAAGDHLRAAPYIADSSANPQYLMGIADQSIANNAFGFVVIVGKVRGIDTSAYAPGTILYVSPTTAGQLTSTKPTAPNRRFAIGAVVKQNASSGILQVRTEAGVLLDDIHNVVVSSPANGHILIYDNAQARWENNTLTAGAPISITNGAGAVTVGLASGYGDTQNPYASKTANTFLAAPNGSNGIPSFRAIVAADIPTLNQNTTGTSAGVVRTVAGTTTAELVRGNMADNDQFRILVGGTATNAGYVEIATADDGTEPIHVRQYTGVFTTLVRTATLLDGSGNTSFPGTITGTRLISNIATGTAPLAVTSTTAVTNLNADLLDGNHAAAFYLASNPSGYTPNTGTVTSVATGSGLTGGTITTTGTLSVDSTVVRTTGDQTIGGNKTFSNNVTITGDLLINGTTTNINTTNLVVEDKNIVLGDVASPTDTTANGGGITLKGATDKTIEWLSATGRWTFNNPVEAPSVVIDGLSFQDTATVTTTSTTQTALASFAAATYGSGKFLIQATQGNIRQISELLVVHDGTTALATEYGIIKTGATLFTTEVDISSGNVRVLITSASATSTVYKTSFTLIGV